ncbi:MAG: rhomboid protease GluP [Polyangiales bacterium]|jgi:rhomboid protease GluP
MNLPPPHVPAKPDLAARNESIRLAQAFLAKVKSRRAYATWGIAVLIALVFALQLAIGHMDSNAAFIRSGALYPPRVFEEGEFWRLASCTLLHADWMHVGFNVYVLLVLGIFVERIIGTPRFLILYVCSAFAGSVGSLFFLGEGFSVGASGAVWGLLGAHAILAFRPTGLLPALMLPGVKKAAMINLGLNVLNSLRPQIDMWAHFAGGAAGALVFLALSRGVPRVPQTLQEIVPDQVPTPKILWPLGLGAMLTLVSLTGIAIVQGKPFELDTAPVFERVETEWLGLSVELPSVLLERTEQATEADARELVVGDAVQDTMMIGVFVVEVPPMGPAEVEQQIASLEGLAVPEGATRLRPPERVSVGEHQALLVRDRLENEIFLDRVFVLYSDRLVRVTAYRWPGFDEATPQYTVMRIAESVQLL